MNKRETSKVVKLMKTNAELMKLVEGLLIDKPNPVQENKKEYVKSDTMIKKVMAYVDKKDGQTNLVQLRKAGVHNPGYVTQIMVKKGMLERMDKGTKTSVRGRPSITFRLASH